MLNFSPDVKNCDYFKLLSSILKPTVRRCKSSNAHGIAVHVPSIKDSINSSVVEISSINNLQVKRDRKFICIKTLNLS